MRAVGKGFYIDARISGRLTSAGSILPMSNREHLFAELLVDRDVLERFSQDMSPYYQDNEASARRAFYSAFKRKLLWHIRHSLSGRQRETLLLILSGKTEREAAADLGVSQQVVHIYKVRAINRLREKFRP
jgi:DNA-binding CsgD family transcriptional regulator